MQQREYVGCFYMCRLSTFNNQAQRPNSNKKKLRIHRGSLSDRHKSLILIPFLIKQPTHHFKIRIWLWWQSNWNCLITVGIKVTFAPKCKCLTIVGLVRFHHYTVVYVCAWGDCGRVMQRKAPFTMKGPTGSCATRQPWRTEDRTADYSVNFFC